MKEQENEERKTEDDLLEDISVLIKELNDKM